MKSKIKFTRLTKSIEKSRKKIHERTEFNKMIIDKFEKETSTI